MASVQDWARDIIIDVIGDEELENATLRCMVDEGRGGVTVVEVPISGRDMESHDAVPTQKQSGDEQRTTSCAETTDPWFVVSFFCIRRMWSK